MWIDQLQPEVTGVAHTIHCKLLTAISCLPTVTYVLSEDSSVHDVYTYYTAPTTPVTLIFDTYRLVLL